MATIHQVTLTPSKDDLVVAVYEQLLDQMHARVDAGIARAERKHARIEHILGEALHQLLPLDKARREEVYLDLTFTGLALDSPRLLAALRGGIKTVLIPVDNEKDLADIPANGARAG